MSKLHPLLLRQLKNLGMDQDLPPMEKALWAELLAKVSKAYSDADQERYLLERSLHISSKEMTERWDAMQALQGQWRSLAECAPDTILTVDRGHNLLFSNRDLLPLGGSAINLAAEEDQEALRTAIDNVFAHGANQGLEIKGNAQDGQPMWYSMRLGPIKDGEGVASVILLINDITNSKKLQEQVDKERAAAIQSSKMATLGEMASGIAHEINNPLCIINGLAMQMKKMASRNKLTMEQSIDLSDKVTQTVNRIYKIIQGLRSFARDGVKDPFTPALVDVLVDETLELCREKLSTKNITLRPLLVPKGLSFYCQSVQISQVLLNLIHNAVDAIETLPEKWIQLEAQDLGENILISVTDSGSGIPETIREKLMHPFFTTKPKGKGTGLGLSISKGIVETHGGRLSIDTSCPNTRFQIFFPKTQTVSKDQAA